MSAVLAGIKVLELCEVFQGPLAGQMLGDFGADVIKIERPVRGDSLRHSDTTANAQKKMGSYFAAVNRNKRSICLNLKESTDRETFLAMVGEADVLMHNYRPGVLERLGFGYADLKVLNPRLIYAAASGFGDTGPLSGMAGQDFLIQSIAGIGHKTTAESEKPTFLNVPIADYTSGVLLAQGILLAIIERQRSGHGQEVQVSLFSSLMAMQCLEAATLLNFDYETHWYERALNFPAKASDGWLHVIGFFRDNPLQLICRALDIEDLSQCQEWSDKHGQAQNKEEIANRLKGEFEKLTVEECVTRLQGEGVLAAPILNFAEALAQEQVRANNLIVNVPVAGQSSMRHIANPVRLSRTPATIRRGPPHLGDHTGQTFEPDSDTQC